MLISPLYGSGMEWKNLVLKAHLNSNPPVPEELVKQGSKLQHMSLQGQATPNHSAHLLLEAVLQDTATSEPWACWGPSILPIQSLCNSLSSKHKAVLVFEITS